MVLQIDVDRIFLALEEALVNWRDAEEDLDRQKPLTHGRNPAGRLELKARVRCLLAPLA